MSRKENRNKLGALDEFLERQEMAQYPNKNVGNFRSSAPLFLLSRFPLFRILLGLSIGIPSIAGLILQLVNRGSNWLNLICAVPMIALSVLFIIRGIRMLRSNRRK